MKITEKHLVTIGLVVVLVQVGFWGSVAYVAVHFIAKVW